MSVLEEYRHRLGIWTDIQGHLSFMHETVLEYEFPVVIELGIQAGNSTSALLSAVEQQNGTLYSCDLQSREHLAAEESGGDRRVPAEWWEHPDWKVFHGDDLSTEALAWMPQKCDVLFVDSDHSYGHVLSVLHAYMRRVRQGGIALFHDTQYLFDMSSEPYDKELPGPTGPVAQAITDYCATHGLTWDNRPGSYGMGIIRP